MDYGLAQSRKRHVLLASKFGDIKLIAPTHLNQQCTVKDVIAHLRPIKAGEIDSQDPLHRASVLSPLNMERIKASRPDGTWKDWPDYLVAECHKKSSGVTYSGVYGRMSWDRPSPTMTTLCTGFGNGRFGHPEQDRAISLREAALLQSFPASYQFIGKDNPGTMKDIARMIGNAVPVVLGEVIGVSFIEHLKQLQVG